jgi:hypothetical protein
MIQGEPRARPGFSVLERAAFDHVLVLIGATDRRFIWERPAMLWTIVGILLLLWVLGFAFHIAGGLIHLLLVIAVVVVVFQLITGRRAL